MFEEEGQLELPFPSVGESPYHTATSPGLSSEASPPHCLENASRQANDAYGNGQRGQARKPRLARRRPNPEDEAALPLPPHRTARNLVFENTRRAAEEASMHRYRQDAQARSSAKSWEPEGFDLRNSPRSGRDDAEDAGYAPGKASIGHPRRPVLPRGHRRPSDSCSEADDVQFVEPEGPAAFDDGAYSPGKAHSSRASQSQEDANDYWALRQRMGPASSGRKVALRRR